MSQKAAERSETRTKTHKERQRKRFPCFHILAQRQMISIYATHLSAGAGGAARSSLGLAAGAAFTDACMMHSERNISSRAQCSPSLNHDKSDRLHYLSRDSTQEQKHLNSGKYLFLLLEGQRRLLLAFGRTLDSCLGSRRRLKAIKRNR
jgi:hypothetical protein